MISHGQWVARTPSGRIVATGNTLSKVVLELLPRLPVRRATVCWEGEPEPCLIGPWEPSTPLRLETTPPPPSVVSPKTTIG